MADTPSKNLPDLDKVIKSKTISASSFKKSGVLGMSKEIISIHKTISSLAGVTRKIAVRVNNLEKTVQNQSRKITSLKNISKSQSERLSGENVGAKLPGGSDPTQKITGLLDDIIKILSDQNKFAIKKIEDERKSSEAEARGRRESLLEKGVGAAFRVAEKVMAPVKSLLSRIMDFITAAFLGRVAIKLLRWFSDKENKKKVDSIIRFFKDHWPLLLTLYLRFGTSLGRFIGRLGGVLARGTLKLGALLAKLAARAGIAKAGRIASFLGGPRAKVIATAVGIGADVAITASAAKGISDFGGIGSEPNPEKPGYAGGGFVIPKFSGGGFNFGSLLSGLSGKIGGGFGSIFSGLVSGERGIDRIPAMLSHGEFVMSAGAVQKYGVDTLEAMNAAGGGTNKPKMVDGTAYAAGGGLIFGDSIASGLAGRHGANQVLTSDARGTSMVGASPSQVLIQLRNFDRSKLKGQTVHLSSGITNNYSDLANVEAQIKYLKDSGAKVKLLGVTNKPPGDRPDLVKGLGKMNNTLKLLADKHGASFTGGFNPSADGIHPANYNFVQLNLPSPSNAPNPSALISPVHDASSGPALSAASSPPKPTSPKIPTGTRTMMQGQTAVTLYGANDPRISSQKRLNMLSYERTAGQRYSRGKRFDAESLARTREDIKRGGIMGQLGRSLSRMFSDPDKKLGKERIARLDAEDKASAARIKQAGAASIGRYYSSSDGKYYKDYNAAVAARKARLAPKPPQAAKSAADVSKPVAPKVNVRYRQGSGGGGAKTKSQLVGSNKSSAPKFSATHPSGHRTAANQYGIK